jgi:hypothetical protein
VCRPQTSFQRLQGDIYGMISDAKTLLLGVVSFADFVPKGRLTRKLTHTVNRTAPMQAFMGAVPIVVGGPLRELFADVGRFGVGSVPRTPPIRFVAHAPLCHSGVGSAAVLVETGWLRPSVGAELPRRRTQRPGQFESAGFRARTAQASHSGRSAPRHDAGQRRLLQPRRRHAGRLLHSRLR